MKIISKKDQTDSEKIKFAEPKLLISEANQMKQIMVLKAEEKGELENLLRIATSQIPKYFNLTNSMKEVWEIQNLHECIFGMVLEKYIHDSGQFLTNKRIDESQPNTVENTMELFDAGIEIFNDHVSDIKRQIFEN